MKLDLKSNEEKLSSVAIKVDRKESSEAYRLCVRADALRFANLHQESIPKYLQSILIQRNNPDSFYGIAVSYKYLGQYDKALENLQKAIEQDDKKFEAFYEMGICYLLSGQPDKAIEALIRALLIQPDNTDAQIQLAMAHELVGEDEMALCIYDKLIETNPGYLKAYSQKASLLICKGKYFEASKIFFQIIKLNANYHKAYLGMGVCFENLHKPVDAKRYYKKFMEMKPDSRHYDYVNSKVNNIRKRQSMTTNPMDKKILSLIK